MDSYLGIKIISTDRSQIHNELISASQILSGMPITWHLAKMQSLIHILSNKLVRLSLGRGKATHRELLKHHSQHTGFVRGTQGRVTAVGRRQVLGTTR